MSIPKTARKGKRNIRAYALRQHGFQRAFDLNGDGVVVRFAQVLDVHVGIRAAGGEVIEFAAGLLDETADGLAVEMRPEGAEGAFEVPADRGERSVQGRQRFVHTAVLAGRVREGYAWLKVCFVPQVTGGGQQIGGQEGGAGAGIDVQGVRQAVTGGAG